MKNLCEKLSVLMLLSLSLFFSPGVNAQSAKDPARDLSVSFSGRHKGAEAGSIFGTVTNKSINDYPCVRIEFNLSTRFDLRVPGEKSRHLGVFPVEVKNLSPRSVRNYYEQLPFPAGIGLKSVSECSEQPAKALPDAPEILSFTVAPARIRAGQTTTLEWSTANTDQVFVGERNPQWPQTSSEAIRAPRDIAPSGSLQVSPSQTITYRLEAKKEGKSALKDVTVEVTNNPPPPPPAATCTISGRIYGPLHFNSTDDRGQPRSNTLTHIYMKTPGAPRVDARLQGRTYIFTNVPAGQTYKIFPAYFRSQPQEKDVLCLPDKIHPRIDFRIIGPPLSG